MKPNRNTKSNVLPLLLLCALLGGCCSQVYKSVFISMVRNAPSMVRAIEKSVSAQYYSAVNDVVKVFSQVNTTCPPRCIKSKQLDLLPLEVDFNLLHEYLGPNDDVRVSTVPAVSPDTIRSTLDLDRLYGISESDNYKFVFAAHRDLYIYVFQIDAAGEVAWQYPKYTTNDDGSREEINPWHDAEGANPTPGDQLTRVPQHPDDWYYFNESGRGGVENFILVASKYRQIELEEALARAVVAAREERLRNPNAFTQAVVDVPLLVDQKRSGLTTKPDGIPAGETKSFETESGTISYTPNTFKSDDETILMVRAVRHLPPR